MKVYEGSVCTPGPGKIAIIVARFNATITERMLDGAVAVLRGNEVPEDDIVVFRVPGAFELPTIAQRIALDESFQAVICLGCVIKGETSHDEHINRAVSLELARIGAENGIPVIFGLLTCHTVEQALARSGQGEQSQDKVVAPTLSNKGAQAALAALEMLHLLEQIPDLPEEADFVPNAVLENAARYASGQFDEEPEDDNDFEETDDDWYPGKRESRPASEPAKPKKGKGKESFSKGKDSRSKGKKSFSKSKGSFSKKNFKK